MCAIDGYNVLATELGAFSLLSHYTIVDTSRRSTTFETRLHKYSHISTLIFPGLPNWDHLLEQTKKENTDYIEMKKIVDNFLKQFNYKLTYIDHYDNHYTRINLEKIQSPEKIKYK